MIDSMFTIFLVGDDAGMRCRLDDLGRSDDYLQARLFDSPDQRIHHPGV
jgi:hypothetical protein